MNIPSKRLELPLEAEPARDFIEQLVAFYEARIAGLEEQVRDLTEQVRRLTPRHSSVPPSTDHPHARKATPGKKWSVYECLVSAVQAAFAGKASPSLLPASSKTAAA